MAPSNPGLIITATDTGVGKTVVACSLVRALRRQGIGAVACKPVETGCTAVDGGLQPADGAALRAAADDALALDEVCPVRFLVPASPLRAAREAGVTVDVAAMTAAVARSRQAHPFTVVEGVGGVAVPLTVETTLLYWFHTLGLPTVVVTTPRLGTLNHTWLTVHALRAAEIPVVGLVVNRVTEGDDKPPVPHAIADLAELTHLPILGRLPELSKPPSPADWDRLAGHLDWQAILTAAEAAVGRPR